MDTYADMVTLLLTFFVMLFSMSSVEQNKWEMLVEAFSKKMGVDTDQLVLTPNGEGEQVGTNQGFATTEQSSYDDIPSDALPIDFDELYQYLKNYVEQNNMSASVEVSKTQDSVFIRFRDNIFFNPDSAQLKKDSYDMLEFLGDCLKSVEDQILMVNINGHTASVAYDHYPVSDRMLSSQRASNVAIYLEERKQMDPSKLVAIGYGKNYPVDTNDTPEGRAKNRRVDMIIVSTESALSNDALLSRFLSGTFDDTKYPQAGSGLIPSDVSGSQTATPSSQAGSANP